MEQKDTKAFEKIVKQYHSYVVTIIYNILHGYLNEIDIQAVVNQVFFQLWNNMEKIDLDTYNDIKPYLGAIARNTAITERNKVMPHLELKEHIIGEMNEKLSQVERKVILSKAIRQLPKDSQIILLKFYFQGKTINQIAQEEKLPESTVKTKLKRSREKLKQILEKEGFVYED